MGPAAAQLIFVKAEKRKTIHLYGSVQKLLYASFMPGISPGRPILHQIADYYRGQIRSGKLKAGEQMPSTNEIARVWGVAAGTVRAAIALLRQEALVVSRHGHGTFVRGTSQRIRWDAKKSSEIEKARALIEDDEERGRVGAAELSLDMSITDLEPKMRYRRVKPPAFAAELLGIDPTERVLEKTWETRSGGTLHQHSVTWIPIALLEAEPRLLDEAEEPWPGGGMHQFRVVGIEVDRMETVVTASMPTPAEQANWRLDDGIPLLRTRGVSFDVDGRPVAVSDAQYPADRSELAFTTELTRWPESKRVSP